MAWQTFHYLASPVSYLVNAHRRYGDLFTARLLGQDWVVLADTEAIREVFAAPHDQMRAGEASRVLQPLIGTRNMLMLDGQEYLERRRLLLPSLHGQTLQRHEQMIHTLTTQELATWPIGTPFPVLPRLQRLATRIIKQYVLGVDGDALINAVLDLLRWLTSTSRLAFYFTFGAKSLMNLPGYQLRQQNVEQQMHREIQRRRASFDLQQRTDILSLLTTAQDANGRPLSSKDIYDETIMLLVAGHENTAATLAWAVHELARNQRIQTQLAADPERWSEPVIAETLRLRPPVPLMPRHLATSFTLNGHRLPAGTNIAPCALLAQRQPQIYTEPLTFHPARFMTRQPAWFPFGGGARHCIGDSLARLETRIIIQHLATTYRLQSAGPPERTQPRALVLVPSMGGRIIVTPQRPRIRTLTTTS